MYSWKEVLSTKELECGGLPCARKLKLAVSILSGSERLRLVSFTMGL